MWQGIEKCGWLEMDQGGPCKLVRSLVELYSEGDIELLEVEMVKFVKF